MKRNFLFAVLVLIAALGTSVYGVTIIETLDTNAPAANSAYWATTAQQTGRLLRNTTPSACSPVKSNPGLGATTGTRQFDNYRFVALGSGCLTVTLTNASDALLFAVAYDQNGLTVADPSLHYLGDLGSSPTVATPSKSFSISVSAGQIFHIVVHEVDPAGGIGQGYTLDVGGVKIIPDFSVTEVLDSTPAQLHAAYNSATGLQTGRLNRFSPASDCGGLKTNPGLFTPDGSRRADLYVFTPASSGCARVTLKHSGADSAQIVAYNQNGFMPTNPSTNYLADPGGSAANGLVSFSFMVKRGVPFYIVVGEVNPGAGIGDTYTLNISNVRLAPTVELTTTLDANPPSPNPEFTTGTGVQTGRLNRYAPASDCSAMKPSPGMFTTTGSRTFDIYNFTPARSGCVQVSVTAFFAPQVNAVAYSGGGFVPANPALNYLADAGSSSNSGIKKTFSFAVSAGVPFSIVVHEVDPGASIGQSYVLEVEGLAMNVNPRAVMFDFDGDRRADPSIFRPSVGEWWYIRSADGGNNAFQFGVSSDQVTPADFTGDGKTDVAFFRPSTGYWYVLRSENYTYYSFPFGISGDIPVPADFDGDGRDDAAVFRSSNGTWYINNSGGGTSIMAFGLNGDHPVPADYDGDNKADIAIFRPSNGQWWLQRSNEGTLALTFGSSTDLTVQGDYTGDGRADVAFFRPSTGYWYVLRSENYAYYSFPFGTSGDVPVPGDYDGDGQADAVVYRPSNHTWYEQRSTDGFSSFGFGAAGDIPVPSSYVR